MALTIREQIIQAFSDRTRSLSSNEIERVRRSQPEGDDRNVSVWDGDDAALGNQFGIQDLSFQIGIHMQWSFAKENPSISVNAVLGEVIQTMLATDRTFGGLAQRMEYTRANPEYPEDGSQYVSLVVIFTVVYSTVLGDPYNKP